MSEQKNPMELLAERDKVFHDFYTNITPTRMPVIASLMNMAVAGYTGKDPMEWHYNAVSLLPAMQEIAQKLYSDVCPFMPPVFIARPAAPYQLLKSQSFKLASNGCVQHPEVVGMLPEEYPELIEKGFDYLVEKAIPRQHKSLDPSDPVKMAYTMQMQINERNNEMQSFMPGYMQLSGMMGYHYGGNLGSGGASEAPFDFLADQLRGFSQMTIDIRRRRSEVLDAVEVLTPLMYKMGRPAYVDYQTNVFYPLHMPTFMRIKDVEELYMPTYKKILQQDIAHGIRPYVALEDNWTKLLDIVYDEFPTGCIFWVDEGDPQEFKDKLGEKFILNGLFPIEYTKTLDTPALLDKTKEFLDIMLPGCGYFFGFNKNPLMASDIALDKYCALLDFVRDYSHFENAGKPFGRPITTDGLVPDSSWDAPIKSKYIFNWDEFKAENPLTPDYARGKLEAANAQTFNWYMDLLM